MKKVASIGIDAFCIRQFDKSFAGTKIDMDPKAFIHQVNELFDSGKYELKDGYAPFCKHVFLPNFAKTISGTLEITKENEHLLQSGYQKRTEKELPVLTRWFPHDKVKVQEAKYLDLILYSREQIIEENRKMGNETTDSEPWGIVSIKAQMEDYETPMTPITVMRNGLGMEHGGSGVPIDKTKYLESVEYWTNHAIIM
jgi:hypothetical protein